MKQDFDIVIKLHNHAMLRLVKCAPGIAQELSDRYTFDVPGAKFMPMYRRRQWDGKIRMLNRQNGEINAGLMSDIEKYCHERGHKLGYEKTGYGLPISKNAIDPKQTAKWIKSLGAPKDPYDHQFKGFLHAIKNKRCVLRSATGSGKSFLAFLLISWYREHYPDNKILVIATTTTLVEQFYNDLKDYGFDSNDYCQMIYEGRSKNVEKPIVISTWQSIHKQPKKWFEPFNMIIGDECHHYKAKSLSSIMNKSTEAEYRFGLTGTVDESNEVHVLQLEGLFGPIEDIAKTKDLQEKGILAPLNIDIIKIKHSAEDKRKLHESTWQEEIDWLVRNDKRNKFICNLAMDLEGNTLVLFNFVEKHGKVLQKLLKEKSNGKKKVFFVAGETATSERNIIRKILENETDAILLASSGTFSTGINIVNLHNIIFTTSTKSWVRVLQSIGRGLRKTHDERTTHLYDIADDLSWRKKYNYTLKHMLDRIRIYKTENFNFKVTEISL